MPVNNVGLLVNFRLGNKPLLVLVRGLGSLSLVISAWVIPAPPPTVGNRGNLLGLSVIGRALYALELNIVKLALLALIDAFTALREGSMIPSWNQRVLRFSAKGAEPRTLGGLHADYAAQCEDSHTCQN